MGHEYVGVVEQVGDDVRNVEVGQFVVGSFATSDNTCEICRAGYQSHCVHREFVGAAQAESAARPARGRHPRRHPGPPDADLIPSLLAASDVLGTGWFAAVAAQAGPGKTVAVVGDGAVGLLGVLAARQIGAERIIAMSRHEDRQKLAARIRRHRHRHRTRRRGRRADQGAHRRPRRPLGDRSGRHPGVDDAGHPRHPSPAATSATSASPTTSQLPGEELFFSGVHLHGGPAPVRRFLPELIDLIWSREIDPGKVFDLTLPLGEVAEGYRAMDERRAIKVLLQP